MWVSNTCRVSKGCSVCGVEHCSVLELVGVCVEGL